MGTPWREEADGVDGRLSKKAQGYPLSRNGTGQWTGIEERNLDVQTFV